MQKDPMKGIYFLLWVSYHIVKLIFYASYLFGSGNFYLAEVSACNREGVFWQRKRKVKMGAIKIIKIAAI